MTKEPKVIYRDTDHSYLIEGERAISGTQAISRYNPPFEGDYWSYNTALKRLLPNIKELRKEILQKHGIYRFPHWTKPPAELVFPLLTDFAGGEDVVKEVQKEVLEEYRMSGVLGTEFHLERERESIERGYEINPWTGKSFPVINPPKKYDNESIKDNLFDLEDGYYPELLVWDDNLQLKDEDGNPLLGKDGKEISSLLAGQADKAFIETIDDIRYFDLDDWKTNGHIPKQKPFLDKMYAPLDHLDSNKYNKYNLQLTLYAGCLIRAGFVCRNIAITHITDYNIKSAKRIDFKYLEYEFNKIFGLY